jgi:RING finger protein 170
VTILLGEFSDFELSRPLAERLPLVSLINQYNARFASQPQSWLQTIRDMPVLLRRCFSEIFTPSGLAWLFRLRTLFFILAAFFYLLVPFDLIPEAFFGIFGLIDDLLIAFSIAVRICIEYREQVAVQASAAGGF